MCINIFQLPVLNINIYCHYSPITLGEDVSNGMQMENYFVLLCSVYLLFTLLSTKHENAQVGSEHQSDKLSSHCGQHWFCD